MTLLLDGGGGRREVMGSWGRSKEIVVDTVVVAVENSLPASTNKSIQLILPLTNAGVLINEGRKENVVFTTYTNHHLFKAGEPEMLWHRCPAGHMIHVNGTRKSCVYTLCATHPCHQGTCVAHSPTKYTCHCPHCPDGYRGHRCETALPVYHEDVGLSFSSLFAICMCFIALLVLLLGISLYPLWRSYKGLKEGVYHVSAHHDGWEDIRENVLNYD
ncbi:hypothetical protein NHX12_005298 [Muraenolepis orangiensis]|uniref:EGF-like domain-containing protein n=1 Tax=Muraenolepis orangiensis TaxID=630683 RepID=A0A9Q0IC61_9TELE|nr:hypothetical protein NHX12_005298 [Muraenolepis orangiensis]